MKTANYYKARLNKILGNIANGSNVAIANKLKRKIRALEK